MMSLIDYRSSPTYGKATKCPTGFTSIGTTDRIGPMACQNCWTKPSPRSTGCGGSFVEARDQDTIDGITAIRMSNNLLWMKIVEIALEHAPVETRHVLRKINDNDRAISDLLKDLAQ
jgi:hypothetical protein